MGQSRTKAKAANTRLRKKPRIIASRAKKPVPTKAKSTRLKKNLPVIKPEEYLSKYISSKWWKARRAKHLAKYPLCRVCSLSVEVVSLEVHHVRYYEKGISLLFQEREKDLRSICGDCHRKVHLYSLEQMFRTPAQEKLLCKFLPLLPTVVELQFKLQSWKASHKDK